ncbi:hypothetical protein COB55_01405 [Candidatus Wolfebacteria bacterium]|nr:MAG: hypothetical protein COB55_01405 [Candidatus Wolfebacteria bacterium]
MELFKENIAKFMPFLEDLRRRLYKGLILFVVFFVIGFFSTSVILKRLLELIKLTDVTVTITSPFQYIEVAMDFGFFLAIIVCVPYVIYSFYAFILPGLTKNERKGLLKSTPISVLLFIAGFSYGFSILYTALQVLASLNISLGIANYWNISKFLSQMFVTSALLGLVFEFPLFLTMCIRMGVVTTEFLRKQRRMAYFLIFVLTSLLPPTDGLSLLAMVLPLMVLYEVTILINNKNYHVWTRT